jgi:hypothetical protein
LDGCSTVWNTLALWNVERLARTGFLPISDGLPARTVRTRDPKTGQMVEKSLPAVAAGVEEVVCISLQQLLYPTSSQAKLLSMSSSSHVEEIALGSPMSPLCVDASTITTSATEEEEVTSPEEEEVGVQNGMCRSQTQLLYDSSSTTTQEAATRATAAAPAHAPTSSAHLSLSSRPPLHSPARRSPLHVPVIRSAACSPSFGSLKPPSICPSSSIPSLHWDATFADEERAQAHAKKMRSKIERAQQQLAHMQLKPGTVQHIHCAIQTAT